MFSQRSCSSAFSIRLRGYGSLRDEVHRKIILIEIAREKERRVILPNVNCPIFFVLSSATLSICVYMAPGAVKDYPEGKHDGREWIQGACRQDISKNRNVAEKEREDRKCDK